MILVTNPRGGSGMLGNTTSGPDEAVLRHLAPPRDGSSAAVVEAAVRALRALAARHDVALVDVTAGAHAAAGGGSSSRPVGLAVAVSAAVGLTAGLLWYLWRTRPRRSTS